MNSLTLFCGGSCLSSCLCLWLLCLSLRCLSRLFFSRLCRSLDRLRCLSFDRLLCLSHEWLLCFLCFFSCFRLDLEWCFLCELYNFIWIVHHCLLVMLSKQNKHLLFIVGWCWGTIWICIRSWAGAWKRPWTRSGATHREICFKSFT